MKSKNKSSFTAVHYKRYLTIAAAALIIILLFGYLGLPFERKNYLEGKRIIIDPGHGGVDSGTTDGWSFFEKDINLQLAYKLKSELEAGNAYVEMTRVSDVSLDERNSLSSKRHTRDLLARVAEFNSGKYDIFISMHINSSSNENSMGPIVIYYPELAKSQYLAQCLQAKLNVHTKKSLHKKTSRKPMESDFFILRNSNIPGVLVESGFISNAKDKKLLTQDNYQRMLAKYLRLGVEDYFKEAHKLEDVPTGNCPNEKDSLPFDIITDVRVTLSTGPHSYSAPSTLM